LHAHSRELVAVYRSPWRVDDREPTSRALAEAVRNARRAIRDLEETQEPELRPLVDKLVIESDLAAHTLNHPAMLQ
jgi:hypothetical protein